MPLLLLPDRLVHCPFRMCRSEPDTDRSMEPRGGSSRVVIRTNDVSMFLRRRSVVTLAKGVPVTRSMVSVDTRRTQRTGTTKISITSLRLPGRVPENLVPSLLVGKRSFTERPPSTEYFLQTYQRLSTSRVETPDSSESVSSDLKGGTEKN